jgi:hypothetical protein
VKGHNGSLSNKPGMERIGSSLELIYGTTPSLVQCCVQLSSLKQESMIDRHGKAQLEEKSIIVL